MRSLLIAIVWASRLLGNCEGSATDDLGLAPSKPDQDERAVADHSGFDQCEAVVASFADKVGDHITNRTYTVSKRWGKVLRARAVMAGGSSSGSPIVTCWTGSGPGVSMFFDFYGPDINDAPATKK